MDETKAGQEAGTLCAAVHPRGARCGKPNGHEGNHRPRSDHHCHARGCLVPTKPEMLMCLKHWRMVPRVLQSAVWATYRQGQCDDKRPSAEWHNAADAAIAAVATKEGRGAEPPPARPPTTDGSASMAGKEK